MLDGKNVWLNDKSIRFEEKFEGNFINQKAFVKNKSWNTFIIICDANWKAAEGRRK